jgi:hypothetical protein
MREPEEVKLELSDGDWLIVKKHLTAGEVRASQVRIIKSMVPGEKVELDPMEVGVTEALAYLLDWSILDSRGNPVMIRQKPEASTRSALLNLDPEKFAEIVDAIKAHDAAMSAAREAEKNVRAGATVSSAISVSAA